LGPVGPSEADCLRSNLVKFCPWGAADLVLSLTHDVKVT
jgi:hypothetical protein